MDEDRTLIDALKRGDESAFSEIFRAYFTDLTLYAKSYVNDLQAAEGIVQEVFIKFWEKRESLNIRSNVKAYLYRSVKNQSLNYLRKIRNETTAFQTIYAEREEAKTPLQEIEEGNLQKAIQISIDNLPNKCQEIFRLRKDHDMSYAEIAEIMDISVNTVKAQLRRAMELLRKSLSSYFTVLM